MMGAVLDDQPMPGVTSPTDPSHWRLRFRARLRRRRLDSAIAAGADVSVDAALALRLRQLRASGQRRAIACRLEHIIAAAAERQEDPVSRLVLDHLAVLAARNQIVALVALLRSDADLAAPGLARARLLVDDPDGPLLRALSSADELGRALTDTLAALRPAP